MMILQLALFFTLICLIPGRAVHADTVVPVRTIRAHEVIEPGDLKMRNVNVPGAFSDIAKVTGQEARIALYPGRPVRPGDVGPPAIVDRNQLILLTYARGGLAIRTEGRAMGRAGVGDLVRVMNLTSRSTVTGRVQPDGSVSVSELE